MQDGPLIAQTLSGSTEAYATLVERYQAPLFALAWTRVGDWHEAQDLTQETFLRAYRALPTLRNPDAFGPWLRSILRNLVLEYFRGVWRARETTSEEDVAGPSEQEDPRRTIETRDQSRQLWNAVQGLDERSREVIVLHYGQGMSVKEIAALTGASRAAVKMRLSRARNRLAGDLTPMKDAWAVLPGPMLKSNVLQAIALTPAAWIGAVALASGLWTSWYLGRDFDRWRGQMPDSRIAEQKRMLLGIGLVFPAAFTLMIGLRLADIPVTGFWIALLAVPLFGVYVSLRETWSFAEPQELRKYFVFIALAALSIGVIVLWKEASMIALGTVFLMGYFLTDGDVNLRSWAAAPFDVWLKRLLAQTPENPAPPQPVHYGDVRGWLRLLKRQGLIRGPLRVFEGRCQVEFAISKTLFAYLPGQIQSTMTVSSSGTVQCVFKEKHIGQFIRTHGAGTVPGLETLNARIGALLTESLQAYSQSPEAALKTLGGAPAPGGASHARRMQKYVLPAFGLIMIITGILQILEM
ncbi:MAG: sigma-70 family RNA polymerase sigma factor [Candidatus Hydrogenedentes bacterium]|nr:sigma-70 family RNA polymerase sigma factor [Candidatus Hydrogenedentota bacterium]